MRRISVSAIQDGDILARDIYSSSGVILMSEGSKLKKEYGLRLADLHVESIFIYDDIQQTETGNIIEEEIKRRLTS